MKINELIIIYYNIIMKPKNSKKKINIIEKKHFTVKIEFGKFIIEL